MISTTIIDARGGRLEPRQQSSLWTDLPSDIGHLILDKLQEVIERVRFSAVCKTWNFIAKEHQKLCISSFKVLPMLFVPTPDDDDAPKNCQFPRQLALFSRLKDYCTNLKLPLILCRQKCQPPRIVPLSALGRYYSKFTLPFSVDRKKYLGFSHGWIAVQNEDYTVTLVYPFGENVLTINLPKLYRYGDSELIKFIISPCSTPEDYVVVVIHSTAYHQLATIKTGEKKWMYILQPIPILRSPCSNFSDIIFFQGKVYAVDRYGMIVKVDICARPPTVTTLYSPGDGEMCYTRYLVESTSLYLYLIQRSYNYIWSESKFNDEFNTYKVEIENGELISIQDTKYLNEDTFFVGCGSSSIAVKTEGCQPNSVYFIDNVNGSEKEADTKVCYYNVEDGTRKVFFDARYGSELQPIWIVPEQRIS